MGSGVAGPSSAIVVALILSVCLLSLKMLFLGVRTAQARGAAKRFINPEDTAWLGGETVPVDIAVAARWRRAHLNDLENLVPFVALGTAYVLLGGATTVGLVYVGVFTVARILHTVAYMGGNAQLRRNAFTAGFLVLAVMAIHVGTLAIIRLFS
jgi:uncharacterized MAPEG superfamily protein